MLTSLRVTVWILACVLALPAGAYLSKAVSLAAIAKRTTEYYFATEHLKTGSLSKLIKELKADNAIEETGGLFVTLSRNGKSRACWGQLTPTSNDLISATVYATIGALTRDYRFPPVRQSELKDLKAQVTVVKSVEPIHSIINQNPLQYGLLVRSGGKSGVLLPGEAIDAYYQLVQCKLKAGIKSGEPCQLYRIRADVYK